MKIIAHRGHRERCPENTMAAFQSALDHGADSIELDVHMTADGELVVHHDYYLGATISGTDRIYEKTLAEIKAFDIGKSSGSGFVGERIPTLEEVYSTFGGKLRFEVELKGFGAPFLDKLSKLTTKYSLWEAIEFTAPPNYLIQYFGREEPRARIGVFVPAPPPWMESALAEKLLFEMIGFVRVNVIHLPRKLIKADLICRLKASGFQTHWADCNDALDIAEALRLGIDQISTDRLELALQLRREQETKTFRAAVALDK